MVVVIVVVTVVAVVAAVAVAVGVAIAVAVAVSTAIAVAAARCSSRSSNSSSSNTFLPSFLPPFALFRYVCVLPSCLVLSSVCVLIFFVWQYYLSRYDSEEQAHAVVRRATKEVMVRGVGRRRGL